MPRRSDMELAFRSAIVHERSGRRVVKTADFVQELLKVNWNLSMGNDSNLLIVF
ncbi:DNA polymerase V, partial [Cronobacter sakazakii]